MADGEYNYSIIANTITNDIPAIAKIYELFPEFVRQVFDKASHEWMDIEGLHTLDDSLTRSVAVR